MNARRCALTALALFVLVPTGRLDAMQVPGDSVPDDRPAAMQTRIYVGMWSTHIRDINEGLNANALIAAAWRGFFGGTLINSFGDRAFAAGIQRSFTAPANGWLRPALGYRLGLITGYDERFLGGVGGMSPVLPFGQVTGSLDHSFFGLELAWTGLAASVCLNIRP